MATNLTDRSNRILSIDILRGIIMLIMALDHVRDFFHQYAMVSNPTDLSSTSTPVFLTRWITHFCAPGFVFLSGMSAYLNGLKKTKAELSGYLIRRGLWLVIVEIVIISLLLSFNPLYNMILLQVIWAIGISMIILGLLLRGSFALIVVAGLILFFGHNIVDYFNTPTEGPAGIVSDLLLTSPGRLVFYAPQRLIIIGYSILPWTGIMLLGYAFGKVITAPVEVARRRKNILIAGVMLTLLFVLLRLVNEYGDPTPWSQQFSDWFTVLSFLNVTKYPASLQYACMTIGPALIFLAAAQNAKGPLARFFSVYGSVPFLYYVLHFFVIHTLLVIVFFATGRTSAEIIDFNSPFLFRPVNFGFSLPVVYALWLLVVLLLYYPCRWFRNYKRTHQQWWLSYL